MNNCTICDTPQCLNFDVIYYCECLPECKYCYTCFYKNKKCPLCSGILKIFCAQLKNQTKMETGTGTVTEFKFQPKKHVEILHEEYLTNLEKQKNLITCVTCSNNFEYGETYCHDCYRFICFTCFNKESPYCVDCEKNAKHCVKCTNVITSDNICYSCNNCIVNKVDYFCSKCSLNTKCEHCSGLLNSPIYYQCISCNVRTNIKKGYRYICTCNSIHIDTKCYKRVFICFNCDRYKVKCPNCPLTINDNINFVNNKQGLYVPASLFNACMEQYGYFFKPKKNDTNNHSNVNTNGLLEHYNVTKQ